MVKKPKDIETSIYRVAILMSTYNGEKYLRDQLDSIFNQKNVEIRLVIRDDGSNDSTKEIIKEYQQSHDNIELIEGENIGCEESFKKLLYLPVEADYYAFSDQDDIWHPDKLISAINNLNKFKGNLSVSNLMLVDSYGNKLRPLFNDMQIQRQQLVFDNLVIGNLHGCVQVWTKQLNDIIQSYYPKFTYDHDVWVNLIANAVGFTHIDAKCRIDYRQHENNTSGYATSRYQRIKKGLNHYLIKRHTNNASMASELLEGYRKFIDLRQSKFNILILIADYKTNIKSKFKLIMSGLFKYTDFSHKILGIMRILFNKY